MKLKSKKNAKKNIFFVNENLPQRLIISLANDTVIGKNCTLISCEIGPGCFIGDRTVILEGSKIGEASILAPNSVVPPGRVIGDHQLWAGNPVRFVRDLKKSEMYSVKMMLRIE